MSLLHKTILVSLVALLLQVCGSSAYAVVKIKGTITAHQSDSVRISFNDNKLAYYPKEFYARVNKKGEFSLQFDVPDSIYILAEVKHGTHLAEIMLTNGDSLSLSVDARHFDSTIQYKGRGADVQNFVAIHSRLRGRLNQYSTRVRNHIEKTPANFLPAIEKEKQTEFDFLSQYESALPRQFVKIWRAHFTYYNYFFLEQYPQMHQMYVLRRYTDTIPEENYAVLNALPEDFNDEWMQVPSYLLYLSGLYETKLRSVGYGLPLSDTANARMLLDSVDKLAYLHMPNKSAEYFIAQSLYARARVQFLERTHSIFNAFRAKWPASPYLPLLGKQIALAEQLAAGQPAPDFVITTVGDSTLKLSDLKGKVVYISFWSTWCRQCLAEMRTLERKVKSVFSNKPVVFVYVSIDEDSAAAKRLQAQLNLSGYFTYTDGSWYAPEAVSYGIQGLPAYFLVDKEGNFAVTHPSTPSQSTELIVAISSLY